MTEFKVSTRYARALFGLAKETNTIELVASDSKTLVGIIENSKDLRVFLHSPVINLSKKRIVVQEVFQSQVSPITLSFLNLLVSKNRMDLILSIMERWNEIYLNHNNIKAVRVSSAVEMTQDLQSKIISKVEGIISSKVSATFSVEPSLKGGFIVKIDDKVYDLSVKSKLEKIFNTLSFGQSLN